MKPKFFSQKMAILTTILMAVFVSCTKDDSVQPVQQMTDLIIVTDSDPASYMMVKMFVSSTVQNSWNWP